MKLRKFIAVTMTAAMMMSFAACANDSKDNKVDSATDSQGTVADGEQAANANAGGGEAEASSTYVFTYNGTTATVDEAADKVISGFGDGYKYFESPSCAFQGLDKVYTYNSFLVRTYPKDDVDYVLSIELRDDSISTPEGVFIGSSEDDVRAAYGDPTEETSGGLEYTQGNCTLAFVINDGKVSAISYNRVSK